MAKSKPLKFILNSNYATLKNDSNTTTVVVTVPSGDSVAGGAYRSYTADVTVGSKGAPMETQINYSIGTQRFTTGAIQVVENAGTGTQYQGTVSIQRPTATTARLRVDYFNGNVGAITTVARTATAYIRTYLPPF